MAAPAEAVQFKKTFCPVMRPPGCADHRVGAGCFHTACQSAAQHIHGFGLPERAFFARRAASRGMDDDSHHPLIQTARGERPSRMNLHASMPPARAGFPSPGNGNTSAFVWLMRWGAIATRPGFRARFTLAKRATARRGENARERGQSRALWVTSWACASAPPLPLLPTS
jgi:hypothetical protein